ncbi:spore coat protein GerQ [Bacillus sp. HMF5848]|uniref:spore coat protein GerQ n=1 Tax=Bacillus sp. HMF5848 TaxID=2495421 RepID=UPI001639F0CB
MSYGAGTPASYDFTGYNPYPMSYSGGGQPGFTVPGYQAPVAGFYGQPGTGGSSLTSFIPGMLPLEESYIENILRLNKGKIATVYMTFENNREWNAKIFKGIIEAAGRDHIILSDPQTGMRYLLLMIYLDYITFDEELDYDLTFGGSVPMAQFPPR